MPNRQEGDDGDRSGAALYNTPLFVNDDVQSVARAAAGSMTQTQNVTILLHTMPHAHILRQAGQPRRLPDLYYVNYAPSCGGETVHSAKNTSSAGARCLSENLPIPGPATV